MSDDTILLDVALREHGSARRLRIALALSLALNAVLAGWAWSWWLVAVRP